MSAVRLNQIPLNVICQTLLITCQKSNAVKYDMIETKSQRAPGTNSNPQWIVRQHSRNFCRVFGYPKTCRGEFLGEHVCSVSNRRSAGNISIIFRLKQRGFAMTSMKFVLFLIWQLIPSAACNNTEERVFILSHSLFPSGFTPRPTSLSCRIALIFRLSLKQESRLRPCPFLSLF